MLDPNILCTPHALSLIRPYLYTGFNTHIHGARWPASHKCRCPITWAPSPALLSSRQAPRLEPVPVLVKRLTARLWRPTCLMNEATYTVFWGDSHHTPSQAHTWPSSTVGKRCRLRFPYTLTVQFLCSLHCFIPSSRFSLNTLLGTPCSLLSKRASSPPFINRLKVHFYLVTAFDLPLQFL